MYIALIAIVEFFVFERNVAIFHISGRDPRWFYLGGNFKFEKKHLEFTRQQSRDRRFSIGHNHDLIAKHKNNMNRVDRFAPLESLIELRQKIK